MDSNNKELEQANLELAEATNVVNILISNFASQCVISGGEAQANGPSNISQNTKDGLKIATTQLSNFIAKMLQENAVMKVTLRGAETKT